jgi:hypothetical protein
MSPAIIEFDVVRPWDDDAKWRSVWNSDVSETIAFHCLVSCSVCT